MFASYDNEEKAHLCQQESKCANAQAERAASQSPRLI